MWLNKNFSTSLFWGIFAAYLLFGAFISVSKSHSGLFECINFYIGVVLMITGVIGLTMFSEIKLIGLPTLIAGAVLTMVAGLGWFCKKMDKGLGYLDDWN